MAKGDSLRESILVDDGTPNNAFNPAPARREHARNTMPLPMIDLTGDSDGDASTEPREDPIFIGDDGGHEVNRILTVRGGDLDREASPSALPSNKATSIVLPNLSRLSTNDHEAEHEASVSLQVPVRPSPRPTVYWKVPASKAYSEVRLKEDRGAQVLQTAGGRDQAESRKADAEVMSATSGQAPTSEQHVTSSLPVSKPEGIRMRKSAPTRPVVAGKIERSKLRIPMVLKPTLQSSRDSSEPKGGSPSAISNKTSLVPAQVLDHQIAIRQRQEINARTEHGKAHSSHPQSNSGPINSAQALDTRDFRSTVAFVEERLKRHLKEVYESHANRVRGCMRRQRFCFEREASQRKRSPGRSGTLEPTGAAKFTHHSSPFKGMKPLPNDSRGNKHTPHFSQDMFTKTRPKQGIKTRMSAQFTSHRSTAVQVPAYREYVNLQDNVLATNERRLLNWPYFADERERTDMITELEKLYIIKSATQNGHDLLMDVYRFYSTSVEAFLTELGCKWEHILYWILAPAADMRRINSLHKRPGCEGFEVVLLNRKLHEADDFNRDEPKWKELLPHLPEPSTSQLRIAALACSAFFDQTKFKLWYLARCGDFMQKQILGRLEGARHESKFEYRRSLCRICQLHDCLFHGELREQPEVDATNAESRASQTAEHEVTSESDYASSDTNDQVDQEMKPPSKVDPDEMQATLSDLDSDIEDIINYRRAVNTNTLLEYELRSDEFKGIIPEPPAEFKAKWWQDNTHASTWENRGPFYPCNHEGACDQAKCRCYRENILCEKTCACSLSCKRRFPGCSCAQATSRQRICGSDKCLCRQLHRECDADLCGRCGASEILDPVNRRGKDNLEGKCCNVVVQRGIPKKTLLGHSQVHGFGLYAGEDLKKEDFIGEYKGEIITLEEGDRRGVIYERQQTMYLFKLNQEQEIDSTHVGNKTRFINTAEDQYLNCYPRNVACNTVQRLGLFASTDIKAGSELFFNYGYSKEQTKHFKQPGGKRGPAAGKVMQLKRKPTNLDSSTLSSLKGVKHKSRGRLSTPERREMTAPARAARLAKYGSKTLPLLELPTTLEMPQRAKKSASSYSYVGLKRIDRDKVVAPDGMSIEGQFKFIANAVGSGAHDAASDSTSTGSRSAPNASQEIQETDAEADLYVPEEEEEDAEGGGSLELQVSRNVQNSDVGAGASDSDDVARRGRRRQSLAPVLVYKRKTRGGRRPGAGRKRKRIVEDESE